MFCKQLCVCVCVYLFHPPNNPAKLQGEGTSANIVFLVIWIILLKYERSSKQLY